MLKPFLRTLPLLFLLAGCTSAGSQSAPAPTPQALASLWDAERVEQPLPPLLRHADVESRLQEVRRAAPDLFSLEEIGQSVERRSINHLWFGRGPFPVLLWSQMHGDEPTATAALFDLFEYVRRHRTEPVVGRMLDALTIHVVPMLNPDGAERYQRRNAQGIDINRDALMLQTPEGRALKALRDRVNPRFGFNLHNQNWRTSVGHSGKTATISLLSVAYDEARSENEGRLLTKRTAGLVRDAVETFAPGHVAKYDDSFEPRAFGDNITKWGTPVLLIETGAPGSLPPPAPGGGGHAEIDTHLVRLNFVALVTALDALASGRAREADPKRYDSLPMNASGALYQLIRRATVIPGTGVAPFTADIGIAGQRIVRTVNGKRTVLMQTRIEEFGDLSTFGAMEVIDGAGLTVAPAFDPDAAPGATIALPQNWSSVEPPSVVAPGQPANLLLLRAQEGGRYRVERVLRNAER
jgi:hypothetical protein